MSIQGNSSVAQQQANDMCGVGNVGDCTPHGTTAPPTPTIDAAWAGTLQAPQGNVIIRSSQTPSSSSRTWGVDPVYFQLSNVEVGTKFEIVNVSKNPDASFNNTTDKQTLAPTGRDVGNRTASVFLTADQMKAIDLQPGDEFQIRAVDSYGNASAAATGQIEATNSTRNMANRGSVATGKDAYGYTTATASGLQNQQLLDGDGTRKARDVLLSVDARPPVFLEDHLHLAAGADGNVHVQMHNGLEPGTSVSVQNQITGAAQSGVVDNNGNLDVSLGKVTEATPLIVSTTSKDGLAGQTMEVIYGPSCPLGWTEKNKDTAPPLNGVIP